MSRPDFEQLRIALLNLGEPEYVPLAELGIDKKIKEAFLKKKINSIKDEVEFWYQAGYDYINLAAKYDTDLLSGKRKFSQTGRAWAEETAGVITNEEDFEKYPWQDIINSIDYSVFEEIQSVLPKGMKIIARAGDIFTYSWHLIGFENFCFLLADNPELIEKVVNRVGEIIFGMLERESSYPNVGAIWYSDDIAYTEGLMVSPADLRKYLFPWMKKIGELAKSKGIPFIYHSDGDLRQVIDELISLGVNALHPIEPKSMDIRELKEKYKGKLCLIGNIEVDLLCRGEPSEIEQQVKQLIKDVAVGGGFCLGSSNSVPNYTKLENYITMINTAKKYGVYPIKIEE